MRTKYKVESVVFRGKSDSPWWICSFSTIRPIDQDKLSKFTAQPQRQIIFTFYVQYPFQQDHSCSGTIVDCLIQD